MLTQKGFSMVQTQARVCAYVMACMLIIAQLGCLPRLSDEDRARFKRRENGVFLIDDRAGCGLARIRDGFWAVEVLTRDREFSIATPFSAHQIPTFAQMDNAIFGYSAPQGSKNADRGVLMKYVSGKWRRLDGGDIPGGFFPMTLFRDARGQIHMVGDCPGRGVLDFLLADGKARLSGVVFSETHVAKAKPWRPSRNGEKSLDRAACSGIHVMGTSYGAIAVCRREGDWGDLRFECRQFRDGAWSSRYSVTFPACQRRSREAWDVSEDGRNFYVLVVSADELAKLYHYASGRSLSVKVLPFVCPGGSDGCLDNAVEFWVQPSGVIYLRFHYAYQSFPYGVCGIQALGRLTSRGIEEFAFAQEEHWMNPASHRVIGRGQFSRAGLQKVLHPQLLSLLKTGGFVKRW